MTSNKKPKPGGCISITEEAEEEYNRLMAILKRNPNCVWAKNELKYLFMSLGKNVGSDADAALLASDRQYHGDYTE